MKTSCKVIEECSDFHSFCMFLPKGTTRFTNTHPLSLNASPAFWCLSHLSWGEGTTTSWTSGQFISSSHGDKQPFDQFKVSNSSNMRDFYTVGGSHNHYTTVLSTTILMYLVQVFKQHWHTVPTTWFTLLRCAALLWVHPRLETDLCAGLIRKCNELLSAHEKQHNTPPTTPPQPPPTSTLAGSDLPTCSGNRKGLEVTSVDSESWLMRLWRADALLSAVKSQPTWQSQSVGAPHPPPQTCPPPVCMTTQAAHVVQCLVTARGVLLLNNNRNYNMQRSHFPKK